MFRDNVIRFIVIAGFVLIPAIVSAQAFPIAVGPDTTFSAGAVFGGVNGIVAIQGDMYSQYNITAQLLYPPDSLIGNRISVGRQGVFPGATVASDMTNYLMVWREFNGDFNGQFISTSGNLVGTYFTIATNTHLIRPSFGLIFGDTTYLTGFVKADTFLYGQLVSKSGNLIGGQIEISNNFARDISVAYDGTNYLVAWVEIIPDRDKDVYGQFVSKTGSLVGSNFLIDGGPYYSDNSTSLAFDGTRYLLGQHESTGSGTMLYGRFITTSGSVEQTILICDSTEYPRFPSVACDGSNYLITWTQLYDRQLLGRFWTPSGVPMDVPFVVLDSIDNNIPFGGCGFGGTMYLVVGSRVDPSFSDGDVYGRFYPQTGIEEASAQKPGCVIQLRSYPNPFASYTTIPGFAEESFNLYDASGRMMGTYKGDWIGADLAPGIYFVQRQNSNSELSRIVKVR